MANEPTSTQSQSIASSSPSETQIKSDFLQMYDAFLQTYQTFNNQNQIQSQNPIMNYDFNAFNKATTNRIHDSKGRKYTKEQIRGYLASPEKYEKQIRDCSIYLYSSMQEYKHLIDYMCKMLTHDYILIPDNNLNQNLNSKKLLSSFYDNLEFIENYNIKSKLKSIESALIKEDLYFGYELSDGDNYIWQRLPSDYCRILGYDEFGCLTFEFDFSYFDRQSLSLDNFASEFKKGYNAYKSDGKKKWQQLSDKGICFKFDTSTLYGLPYFSGLFSDLMGIEEYKDDQEESSRTNNYKLIALEIPLFDKEKGINQYLVTLDHIANFVSNVQKNTGSKIGAFAYPGRAEALNLNNSQFEENMVSKAQNDLFTSAGVSKLIGNSEKTSMGLERSINDDETTMFSLLRQYELWFKKRLRIFNGNKYRWKLEFLDSSIYNKEKIFEKYLKSGISGFNKFYITSSLSISQQNFLSLANLEKQLDLESLLIVLPNSNTQDTGDQGGRPVKSVNSKTDAGIITDDTDGNKNKNFEEEELDDKLEEI